MKVCQWRVLVQVFQLFPCVCITSLNKLCLPKHGGLRRVGTKWSCSLFRLQKQKGSLGEEQCFQGTSLGTAAWTAREEMLLWEGRYVSSNGTLHGLSVALSFLVPTALLSIDSLTQSHFNEVYFVPSTPWSNPTSCITICYYGNISTVQAPSVRWAPSRSKSIFCWSSFLEKAKGSKSPPVANGSLKQWEKMFSTGTRESCNLSCLCLCCSVTQFAACLCEPWGCALCDLCQFQPLPPQQAAKDTLRQAAFSSVILALPAVSSGAKQGM